MFQVKYCLPVQDWQVVRFKISGKTLADAWTNTYCMIKQLRPNLPIEFIPLGNYSFLIWGDGKCQGFIAIEETHIEVPAFDLEVKV